MQLLTLFTSVCVSSYAYIVHTCLLQGLVRWETDKNLRTFLFEQQPYNTTTIF